MIGSIAIYTTSKSANESLRDEILTHAKLAASAINLTRIEELTGTRQDLQTPNYLRLKGQLASICKATPKCRFVYLVGRNNKGVAFFYADSEPLGSKNESVAGDIYTEITPVEVNLFTSGEAITIGPTSDRWGTWISAMVPLIDPQTKKIIAFIGMDFDAKNWNWLVAARAAFPVGLLLLVTITAIIAFMFGSVIIDKFLSRPLFKLTTVVGRLWTFRDITERKAAEAETLKNQERLSMVAENFPGGIIVLFDKEFRYHLAEGQGLTTLQLSKDDLLGKTIRELFPEIADNLEEKISNAFSGKQETFEILFKDLIFSETVLPVVDHNGKIDYVLGVIVDITEKKKAEDSLASTYNYINNLLDSASQVSIIATNNIGQITVFNKGAEKMLGYSPEEMIGESPIKIHVASEIESYGSELSEKTGRKVEGFSVFVGQARDKEFEEREWTYIRKDGSSLTVSLTITALRDQNREITGFLGIAQDITERKLVEEKSKIAKETYESIFNSVSDAIYILDQEGTFVDINRGVEIMYGYTREELLGKTPAAVSAPDMNDLPLVQKKIEEVYETGVSQNIDFWGVRKNGEIFLKDVSINRGKYFGNNHIIAASRDITDRKRAEEQISSLAEMQQTLTKIANTFINAPLDQIETTINDALQFMGRFTQADRVYVFSYDLASMVAINTYEWCNEGIASRIHDLQSIPLDRITDLIEKHINGDNVFIHDVNALSPEDRLHTIFKEQGVQSMMGVPLIDSGTCKGFVGFEAVRELNTFGEKEQQILHLFAQMLVNLENRRKVQNQLLSATKEAEAASKAKSEFLANMSHEIRTPLNGVIGFTDLLRTTTLDETQQKYVENANISGHTLLGIINDILDFSKIEAGMLDIEPVKTDMIELLQNCIDIVKFTAGKKELELLLNIDPEMPRFADVDPVRLKQVLANLLSNAVKFTEAGEVELKVKYNAFNNVKGKLSFSVRDTGIGISEEQKKKLFKAFSQADSSTTRKYGGTGLGLIISEMITAKMGGKIQFFSTPNVGTTFFFELIIMVHHGENWDVRKVKSIKRCLIIDDNINNYRILEQMLKQWQISCEYSNNGIDAIKRIKTSLPFNIIICDYNMPQTNGLETIRIVRENLKISSEKQRVILLHSALESNDFQKRCDEMGIIYKLSKPVKSKDLFDCLVDIAQQKKKIQKQEKQDIALTQTLKVSDKQKVKILIAEDVSLNMILIKAILSKHLNHVEIIEATNGCQAIELYKANDLNLIFMDVQMPECDGIEATQKIREIEQSTNRHVPIIALTAGALKEEREKCFEAGMDDFLTKPVEQEKTKAVVDKYLINISD